MTNKQKEEFSINTLLKLLRKDAKKLLLILSIVLTITTVYSLIAPHQYVSVSSIFPPKEEVGGGGISSFLQGFGGGGSGFGLGGLGESNELQIFMEIVKSRTLALMVEEKLNLFDEAIFQEMNREDQINLLQELIQVYKTRNGILIITGAYKTQFFPNKEDSQYAAEMCTKINSAILESLDEIVKSRSMSSAKQSRIYIEEELITYRHKLDSVANEIEDFQKENNVLEIDKQTEAIVNQAVEIGAKLAEAELELNLANIQYTETSPIVTAMKQQYGVLLEQYMNVQKGGLRAGDKFSIPLENVPNLLKQYAHLYRERKIYEQVIFYLETQRHQEAIKEQRDIPVVEILDNPSKPEKREKPKRKIMLLTALLVTLILLFILFTLRAFWLGNLYIRKESKESVISE